MKQQITTLFLLLLVCTGFAQKNQNEILNSYNSGKFSVYKVDKVSYNNYKFNKVKKPWPIEFTKSGADVTNVLVKRAGILDENFKPDVPGHPAYFSFSNYRLTFIDNLGIYYTWNSKEQAAARYVFVKDGGNLHKSYDELNKLVANYAKSVFKNQTGARAEVKVKKAQLAEEERKKNSLQNKQANKIEIVLVNTPKHVAHFSEAIKYGVVATLKNGSKLKTKNLGGKLPWSDFKVQNKGCSSTIDEVRVDESAKSLKNDQITIQITSKYHPSLKAVKRLSTTNDIPVQVSRGGFNGWDRKKHTTVHQGKNGQHAGRGDNLTVKVKTVTHKQNGKKINKIEIFNRTKNELVAQYKLTPNTKLIIYNGGGRGMDGFNGRSNSPNGGNGGDGGAGGNITLIKDPSVKTFNVVLNNQGGSGGRGGAPKYSTSSRGRNGRKGSSGSISRQVKPVNLNF